MEAGLKDKAGSDLFNPWASLLERGFVGILFSLIPVETAHDSVAMLFGVFPMHMKTYFRLSSPLDDRG